jgi:hypothetical protein
MEAQPENVIQKFNKFWNSLQPFEQNDLYDLLAAVRGPDEMGNGDVKQQFTIPIRHLLFPETWEESNIPALSTVKTFVESLNYTSPLHHYGGHVLSAYLALYRLNLVRGEPESEATPQDV